MTKRITDALKKSAPPAEEQPAKPTIKLPKSLPACADLLYTTQQARFALNKEAEKLNAIEVAIRERFINELPKSNSTGIAGKIARVKIENKTIVSIKNKSVLQKWADGLIKKNPSNREVWYRFTASDKVIKDLWDHGKKVPGAERMQIPTVSLHKV